MKEKNLNECEKAHDCHEKHSHHHEHGHCCHCHDDYKLPKFVDYLLFAIALVLLVAVIVLKSNGVEIYPTVLFILAYIAVGAQVFYGLIRGLFNKRLSSEKLLMAIASIGAIAVGEGIEGMLVMLLFRVGEFLEEYAEGRTKKSIKELLKLKPKTVKLKTPDGKFRAIAPENLSVGDVIIVNPGETIGADGCVVSGKGEVNTASITGESLPISVAQGSSVLFGYSNVNSPIEVRVTATYADGTFAKIVKALEENLEKKSKHERFISKFAKYYTPIVIIAAVLLFAIGGAISGDFYTWFYRCLLLLAISCPCALVISVPLTFFVGLGYLSKEGLLLKGSSSIEKLAKLDFAAFDKTGTLTDGRVTVSGIDVVNGFTPDRLMTIASSLEKFSSHPIAKAIVKESENYDNVSCLTFDSVEEVPGIGMHGVIENKSFWCGNITALKMACSSIDDIDTNFTGVYAIYESSLVGRIFVSDRMRDGAKGLFAGLRKNKIKTAVLTGDRGIAVNSCKEELSPDYMECGLLPQEKSDRFSEIKSEIKAKSTLYLGDGINDAPVMALADVGIAMGISGADVTIETADGILMNEKPETLLLANEMSKLIVKRAKLNVVFAFIVKLLVVVLGGCGFANMWLAMIADVGVLIAVIINSLRRYRIK